MKHKINFIKLACLMLLPFAGKSQNPIIQTIYNADPAALVYKDTLYLYTGHDEVSRPKIYFKHNMVAYLNAELITIL